ncbi:hypothetical protein DJ568_16195 [Mucilaginibacter hurinus]|uniref:Ricin B lectin domain-containing protein n=1 Tax=Mucilaginibacter hurinus TaxID=2201324 RepID=A0A367GLP1_9SPHI|nr:RICIN domain-containing protein [Mucilaginibacter hurinus]RCH53776.1 hypothetical protein DJ568_16195 [Mucilaginibacter hurinus]
MNIKNISIGIALIATAFFMQSCSKKDTFNPGEKSAIKGSDRPKANNGIVIANGRYFIASRKTSTVNPYRLVEIGGAVTTDGAEVKQWDAYTAGDNPHQRWDVQRISTESGVNYYRIINVKSGKVMDLFAGSTADGQIIRQYPYTGSPSQLWSFEPVNVSGTYWWRIKNKNSGKYMTLEGNNPANGTFMTQRPLSSTAPESQQWVASFAAPDDTPPADASSPTLSVSWPAGDGVKISHAAAVSARYGRVMRLSSTTLLATYNFHTYLSPGKIAVAKSTDNGATWTLIKSFEPSGTDANYYHSNFKKLANGDILLGFTSIGVTDDNANDKVYLSRSTDDGATWSNHQVIVYGRSWEPAFIQYSSGEVQVFYSNEAPYYSAGVFPILQQEITMKSSPDNGVNWSLPKTVAFTANMRDGMANPIHLGAGKGAAFAIESVNAASSPYIVWSNTGTAKFKYGGYGTVANGRRWLHRANPGYFGGAPYLALLPNGNTALSFHYDGGRTINDWQKSTMGFCIGNTVAKNFSAPTQPWPGLPADQGAIENSITVDGSNAIFAVSSRRYTDGHYEVRMKRGTF